MISRRIFLKTVAAAGSMAVLSPIRALSSRYQDSSGFFGLHPFIENHPEAVFIMRTFVDDILNSEAKKQAGLEFSRSIIIPRENGIPLTNLIPIKPNIRTEYDWVVNYNAQKPADSSIQGYPGTDAYFTEGLIEAMKELGLSGDQFFIREVNTGSGSSDYPGIAERTGAELRYMGNIVGIISENDLQWIDLPSGTWFRKIPYLWPINAPETWLLNIAKFKTHGMGLTLCCKNHQGSIALNYQELCSAYHNNGAMYINSEHWHHNAHDIIKANYDRHVADGIPRWDRPGTGWNSGLGMERWATRTLENHSATTTGLHIIEGIYGLDGNGFGKGPHAGDGSIDVTNKNGLAKNYMTNIIIFGKNPVYVDIIGHWLGGHEPGNFGLFHVAKDYGWISDFNPMNIPVYEWKADGTAVKTSLNDFERAHLLTYYLQRDYGGQNEPYWHMCDEPFDYSTVKVDESYIAEKPEAFVLHQNRPNPFNPFTSIEYHLPQSGYARLEIFNTSGQLVDVLVNGYCLKGSHMAVWNTGNHASGIYYYQFRFRGYSKTMKMTLLK